ncbi:MAG: N-acetylmuramoyl-L-alanine amidase [Pedobacter sp.]|nr:MAG: N-acetylmuramoyl-L-alanine amidase [Pedobacter sp.]
MNLNRYFSVTVFAIALIVMAGCSANKYAATNRVYKQQAKAFSKIIRAVPPAGQAIDSLPLTSQEWVGTVNMGIRRPNFVILHHTAQESTEQTLKTFTLTRTAVSSHYVVGADGKVVQMVNDYLRAQHAGVSKWGNATDLNSSSIGIEIDNNGLGEPYTDAQINSLLKLCAALKKRYSIPTANFIGHADIAPKRKPDPANFPWKLFAEKGFGLWYTDPLETPPDSFDTTLALRIIGYDISDLNSAIIAFKRHFVQKDLKPNLTDEDKAILFNLYKKYL